MKTTGSQGKNTVPAAAYVLGTAFLVGGMAGVAGFFGGFLIYPGCNLAPLLCIPTGGAGIVVGLILGVALSAFRKPAHSLRIEFRWLESIWALTLSLSILLDCDLLFVSLQVLPTLLGLILLSSKRLRPNIPKGIRGSWPVVLVGALLILVTSLFPPVSHNKWMPVERRPVYTDSNPMPKFLFCNSPRLDASRSYAELSIDSNQLLLEWLAIMIGTGLLVVTLQLHNKHKLRNGTGGRTMKGTLMVLLLTMLAGCITTEESYEDTRNPAYQQDIENELKTEVDWERWHKQQKHNKNAIIIL